MKNLVALGCLLALSLTVALVLWRTLPTREQPAPAPKPAADGVVRVLSLLPQATIDSVLDHPERLPAEAGAELLFRETCADPALPDWRRFREPRAQQDQPSFRVQTAPDGTAELWCERHGESLYRFVPVAPGTLVQATVRVRGDSPVYAVEYKNPHVADDFSRLQKARPLHQVALGAEALAGTDGEFQLVTKTWMVSARTRMLAIGIIGKQEDGQSAPAVLREISLSRAGGREFLAHMRDAHAPAEGATNPLQKRLDLDARRADALFVPPPTRVAIPLPAALGGRLFRCALALDAGGHADGVGAKLAVVARRGEQELTSLRREIKPSDFAFPAAWLDVALELPPEADHLEIETAPLSAAGHRDSLAFYVIDPVLVPRARTDARPNFLLISIDTLRRDHLSCYGYPRPTSPSLDRLAAQGTLIDDCIAQCSYTLPSHVSMLSGQYPTVHGVRIIDDHITPKRTVLISELLQQAGYRTAAFAGGLLVHSSYGYERGFDAYADRDPVMGGDGDRLVTRYLEQSTNAPFFLFVHTYAVHDFVTTPKVLAKFHQEPCGSRLHGKTYLDWGVVSRETGATDEDQRHIVDLYDAAISSTDAFVGGLLAKLASLGLERNTVVLVTSDHGKELLERGVLAHGHTLYDEMIRVPLLLRGPGIGVARATSLAELVDIPPTILELAGLTMPALMQGQSLLRRGERGKSGTYSELVATTLKHAWRTPLQKIIESLPRGAHDGAASLEIYDLVADPNELKNLDTAAPFAATLKTDMRRLQQVLERRAEEVSRGLEPPLPGIDEELRERLRAQGYIGKGR